MTKKEESKLINAIIKIRDKVQKSTKASGRSRGDEGDATLTGTQ